MARARREVLKMVGDLAVEFADTVHSPADPAGSLHSWSDLVDFLELRGGVASGDGAMLRRMGETDARRCAGALAQALRLRETIRAMLGAMASKRSLRMTNRINAWHRGREPAGKGSLPEQRGCQCLHGRRVDPVGADISAGRRITG